MGPVKDFFNMVGIWMDVLKYGYWWLVLDRHLDYLVVNVFDDIIVICWTDYIFREDKSEDLILDTDEFRWEIIVNEGWVGRRGLSRHWEHSSPRLWLTLSSCVSAWRLSIEAVWWHPVAIVASFWIVWRIFIEIMLIAGNQKRVRHTRYQKILKL